MTKKQKMHKVWLVNTEQQVHIQTYEIKQTPSLTKAIFNLLLSRRMEESFIKIMWILTFLKFRGTTRESEITQVEKMILQYSNQEDQLILIKLKLSVFHIGTIKVNMPYNFEKHRIRELWDKHWVRGLWSRSKFNH